LYRRQSDLHTGLMSGPGCFSTGAYSEVRHLADASSTILWIGISQSLTTRVIPNSNADSAGMAKRYFIGLRLQAPGLAQVREHRPLVRPLFHGPRELRRFQNRSPKLARQGFQAPGDVRHLLHPLLHPPVAGHPLQIVHDHQIEPHLPVQPTARDPQLQRRDRRRVVEVDVDTCSRRCAPE